MITVTTRAPSENQRIQTVKRMREAGQVIAYTLADNTGIGRQAATALAMFAEKNGHLESHGYTFTITKEATK